MERIKAATSRKKHAYKAPPAPSPPWLSIAAILDGPPGHETARCASSSPTWHRPLRAALSLDESVLARIRTDLNDDDRWLLDHFLRALLPGIFPLLDTHQHGCVGAAIILPLLHSNSAFLHCCLDTAAQHAGAHRPSDDDLDTKAEQDSLWHRYAATYALCRWLETDRNNHQVLDVTLGLLYSQTLVGSAAHGRLDMAWHRHFRAAVSQVQTMKLPQLVLDPGTPAAQVPYQMALVAWVDILGATMLGTWPSFAHLYREKHQQAEHRLGLLELMGCEDGVMYLISEIACLESLRKEGLDDATLRQYVSLLDERISLSEAGAPPPRLPLGSDGSIVPTQLAANVTAAFRLAARIYLGSLLPCFHPSQPSTVSLVARLADVLRTVPSGVSGFDRCLVWVYLMGGSASLPRSTFRALLERRSGLLDAASQSGSFGRMRTLLRDCWGQNEGLPPADGPAPTPAPRYVSWREVMQRNGWNFLLI